MGKRGEKQKPPKKTDKKQFERFLETARKLGVEDSGDEFEKTFSKLAPPKIPQKK